MPAPRKRLAASVLIPVLLASCTEYWVKQGAVPGEWDRTKSQCDGHAYAQYPPYPQQIMIRAGYRDDIRTDCTGYGFAVTCTQSGGDYHPPAYVTFDANSSSRNGAMRSCLFENGWSPDKSR